MALASVDTPSEPFATADALGVTFGARTLIGDVQLRRVSLAAPRLTSRDTQMATTTFRG